MRRILTLICFAVAAGLLIAAAPAMATTVDVESPHVTATDQLSGIGSLVDLTDGETVAQDYDFTGAVDPNVDNSANLTGNVVIDEYDVARLQPAAAEVSNSQETVEQTLEIFIDRINTTTAMIEDERVVATKSGDYRWEGGEIPYVYIGNHELVGEMMLAAGGGDTCPCQTQPHRKCCGGPGSQDPDP